MTGVRSFYSAVERPAYLSTVEDEVPDRAQLGRFYGTPSDTQWNKTTSGEGESHFGHGSSRGGRERPAIHMNSKLSYGSGGDRSQAFGSDYEHTAQQGPKTSSSDAAKTATILDQS